MKPVHWYRWTNIDQRFRLIGVPEAEQLIYHAPVKVDVDRARALAVTHLLTRLRHAGYDVTVIVQRLSPSGHGWHRWLKVEPVPLSAVETVAIQLLCGSDPLREAYCLRRAKTVDEDPHAEEYWRNKWNVLYKRSTAFA